MIVIQEAFGVNDHIKDVTRRIAAAGYVGVAPAMFHRAGGGTAPYDDFNQVMPLFEGISDDGILDDVDATVAHLEARVRRRASASSGSASAAGSCSSSPRRGARRRGHLLRRRHRARARSGLPPLIGEAADLQTPWLGLFGDLDKGIPVDDVEVLRARCGDADVVADIVRYADADHGFHCDVRGAYHEDAARDAWQRALEWFDTHIA